MYHLPLAMVLSQNAMQRDALSARPDAPVVHEPTPRPRARRTRSVLASGLRRVAIVIEPGVRAAVR